MLNAVINPFSVAAGPCAIESYEIFLQTAKAVKASGCDYLRGGIYKLRTHPDSFQGLREKAYDIVRAVKNEIQLPFITEITDVRQIDSLPEVADVLQVGTRNMYNYELLKELGKLKRPVILKRGFSATIKEWLQAAEYILKEGNQKIILCERGIRTFETALRNTLDLSGALYAMQHSSFPVWIDPSHATGHQQFVGPMAIASTAAGMQGLLIEIHPNPEQALSDKEQALNLKQFNQLMQKVYLIRKTLYSKNEN